MKKFMTIAGAALLATSIAGAAYAQGANPNAPQPDSTGTGVYAPGTSSTGQAVDTKQNTRTGTTGSAASKERKSMQNGMMKKEETGK